MSVPDLQWMRQRWLCRERVFFMNGYEKNLAILLQKLRRLSGKSREETARAAGMEPEAYTLYERGECLPDIPALRKLAGAFRISAELFLYPELVSDFQPEHYATEEQGREILRKASQLTEEEIRLVCCVRGMRSQRRREISSRGFRGPAKPKKEL